MANQKITGDLEVGGRITLPAMLNTKARRTSSGNNSCVTDIGNKDGTIFYTNQSSQILFVVFFVQSFGGNITVTFAKRDGTLINTCTIDYLTNAERTEISIPVILQPNIKVTISGDNTDHWSASHIVMPIL